MTAISTRVERIVSLVAELTTEERAELVQQIEALEQSGDAAKRARVAEAIRRVVTDHPTVLAALAK